MLILNTVQPLMPNKNFEDYAFDKMSPSDWDSFIAKGEIDVKDISGNDPLSFACEKRDLELAQRLIKAGADVNSINKFKESNLYFASYKGNFELAKLLIKNGADVNFKEENGRTPLHLSISQKITKLLIKDGAQINALDKAKNAPLHYARDLKIINVLLKSGADISLKNIREKTPLDDILYSPVLKLNPRNRSRIIDVFYNHQIQLDKDNLNQAISQVLPRKKNKKSHL